MNLLICYLYAKFLCEFGEFVHDMKKEDIFPFIFCHKNAINKKESSSDFLSILLCRNCSSDNIPSSNRFARM